MVGARNAAPVSVAVPGLAKALERHSSMAQAALAQLQETEEAEEEQEEAAALVALALELVAIFNSWQQVKHIWLTPLTTTSPTSTSTWT